MVRIVPAELLLRYKLAKDEAVWKLNSRHAYCAAADAGLPRMLMSSNTVERAKLLESAGRRSADPHTIRRSHTGPAGTVE